MIVTSDGMSGVSTAAKDRCIKDSVLVRGTSCVNAHYKRYCSHVEQQPRPPLHATAQAAEHVGRHPCITASSNLQSLPSA